jgi:DNA-binding HxlR family transcriptional regulator
MKSLKAALKSAKWKSGKTDEPKSLRRTTETAARAKEHKHVEPAPDFDRVVHERLRLGILSALAAAGPLTFNDLKKLMSATDGNLSVHARKLEDAAYIVCEKSFSGRMPRTEYRITSAGRKALDQYLNAMESFIKKSRSR